MTTISQPAGHSMFCNSTTTMPQTVTKEIAMQAKHGDIFQSKTLKQGPKGVRVPLSVRVTGKCQTWKREPKRFRLPVKWSFYESWAIDDLNCGDWEKP
jgi:hypothetical protein